MSQRAFDVLPIGHQKIVRAAAAKFVARFEDVGHTQEQRLLSDVFERQGIKRVLMDPAARDEFFDMAQRARQARPEPGQPAVAQPRARHARRLPRHARFELRASLRRHDAAEATQVAAIASTAACDRWHVWGW